MKANSKSSGQQTTQLPPELREQIETRAYHIWKDSGGGDGDHVNHWLQAEKEILEANDSSREKRSSIRKK